MMDAHLYRTYYNPKCPAAFGSAEKLYQALKTKLPSLSLVYVKNWLSSQEPYSLHKQIRRNFKRNRVLVSFVNEEFQADLLDVSNLSSANKGVNFLLTVVDVLSKYAYAIPLKNKSAISVASALKGIFNERVPALLHTDDGNEFKGPVKTLLREFNVYHVIANDTRIKCSVVERFNKTLKLKLVRLLQHTKRKQYLDQLPDLIHAYNHTVHSSIKMRPIDVTLETQQQAFDNLYQGKTYRELLLESFRKKTVLKVGDFVRVRAVKKTFGRGYHENWTKLLYKISQEHHGNAKPTYSVVNSIGQALSRRYYKEDLQKVIPRLHSVSLTGRKRHRNGVLEIEVIYQSCGTISFIPQTRLFNE